MRVMKLTCLSMWRLGWYLGDMRRRWKKYVQRLPSWRLQLSNLRRIKRLSRSLGSGKGVVRWS